MNKAYFFHPEASYINIFDEFKIIRTSTGAINSINRNYDRDRLCNRHNRDNRSFGVCYLR